MVLNVVISLVSSESSLALGLWRAVTLFLAMPWTCSRVGLIQGLKTLCWFWEGQTGRQGPSPAVVRESQRTRSGCLHPVPQEHVEMLFVPVPQLHFIICRGMAGLEVMVKPIFNGFIIRNLIILVSQFSGQKMKVLVVEGGGRN